MEASSSPEAEAKTQFPKCVVDCVEAYWAAISGLMNTIEDIEGADGRIGYLLCLRYKLLEAIAKIDGFLCPPCRPTKPEYLAAYALKNGVEYMHATADEVMYGLCLDQSDLKFDELQRIVLAFANLAKNCIPGVLPEAQGPTGQRELLHAMRLWSSAAEEKNEDIGFLAQRILDL
ncbi:MAG: DUF6031 family protein [Pseudomonadota bacterium]